MAEAEPGAPGGEAVNARRAKRMACTIAHKLIDSWLDRDYGDREEPLPEADEKRLEDAMRQLSQELWARGMTDQDGEL